MADQLIYGCAETGAYSTDAPNPNVELSGSIAPGYAIGQTFVSALSNSDTVTVTIRKDATNWAVYTGAVFTTGTPNLIDLSGATLAESAGTLSDTDSVEVLGLMPVLTGKLAQSAQTITTADVTGAVNTHYLCTIAGLTANRNLTLPTATAGDKIRVTILDGDEAFGLVLIGAATVTINGGSAATAWRTLAVAGHSIEFEAVSATAWVALDTSDQVLVARAIASDSAQIDLALPAGFSAFRLVGDAFMPATDAQDCELQVSIDNGSTYATSGYLNAAHYAIATANSHIGSPVTGAMRCAYVGSGGAASRGSSFDALLYGHAAGSYFRLVSRGAAKNNTGAFATMYSAAQYDGSTDRVTHIRLKSSSGNIASGTFSLYGLY